MIVKDLVVTWSFISTSVFVSLLSLPVKGMKAVLREKMALELVDSKFN